MKLVKILALATALLLPLHAQGAPITIYATQNTETSLTIFGSVSGPIDTSRVHKLGTPNEAYQLGKWLINLEVKEYNALGDAVTLYALIVHQSPTGHIDGTSDIMTFDLKVFADNQVGGTVSASQGPDSAGHGPHLDLYLGSLTATVAAGGGGNNITGYEFELKIGHCGEACADDPPLEEPISLPATTEVVPEPGSLALLGIGLAVLRRASPGRRRRGRSRS